MFTQENKFQVKHSCVTVLFQCVPVTNGGRRGRAGCWDTVILRWLVAPGQVGWEGVGRRREADHRAGWGALMQKQNKGPALRI